MATISEFVDGFARKHDQYVQIEKGFEKFCRAKLENLKIQFTWQSRVKGAESLRKKLQDRSQDYEDDIHNINDIKDLVAGRVILTRWKDFQPVEDVIRASFDIKGCIQHPKSDLGRVSLQERFRGYDGLHFHVTRRVSDGEQSSELIIEIQVVSAFMWAFQTLHHDVVYKKLSGDPSKNLLLHIDMLKGIANMGEIAMELYEELLHSDSNSPLPLQSAACSDTLFGIAEFAQKKKEIISNHIRNQKEYEKILRWVSKVNVEGDHHQIREKLGPHYEDSGQWFRSLHNKWVTSSENPIFWLVGSVGTGKSSLVSSIIEWQYKKSQSMEKERLAFFYCSRKKGEQTTSFKVLCSLLAQLARIDNGISISPLVRNMYDKRQMNPIKIQRCSDLLADLIKEYRRTIFIIDALDECEDADTLLLHLKHLYDNIPNARNSIRIFFSSRYDVDVAEHFSDCEKLELETCRDRKYDDMKFYIETQIKDRNILRLGSRLLKGKYPELENRLINVLLKNSQGMFQWVKLQLDLFFGSHARLWHERDVTRKLDMLEKKNVTLKSNMLDQAYEDVYNNNTEEDSWSRVVATRALKWMICAQRSLFITELAEVTSINEDGTRGELTEETLLKICSNFIIADEGKIAQFPHLSVKEYLEKREVENVKEYSTERAHIQAAVTCLRCLSIPRYHFEGIIKIQDKILEYSFFYWIDHMAAIEPHNRPELLQDLYKMFLLETNENLSIIDWLRKLSTFSTFSTFSTWQHDSELLGRDHKYRYVISDPPNPLFAACSWGLIDMIPESSLTRNGLSKLSDRDISGLALGSLYGHDDIVKFLLEKGAQVGTHDGLLGTALQAASSKGYESIVRLLLDNGATVDSPFEGPYTSSLQKASYGGHTKVVELLLDHNANVNALGGEYGTALQAASGEGYESIVRLLLDAGADVNAQGGYYGNSLQEASSCGYESIVRLLLDAGANVNAQGGNYGNALQAASSGGHEKVVRLLLDAGANVNAQGGYYENALQAASYRGSESIVRLLLDAGANVNVQGGNFENALQAASYRGSESIVRLLLDAGVNVNAEGGYFGNALQAASYKGHESIVRLLLDAGANVNAQGGYYGNSLQGPSLYGHENAVRLMLDTGAYVSTQDGKLKNALQAPSYCGFKSIVRLLLDAVAENDTAMRVIEEECKEKEEEEQKEERRRRKKKKTKKRKKIKRRGI